MPKFLEYIDWAAPLFAAGMGIGLIASYSAIELITKLFCG